MYFFSWICKFLKNLSLAERWLLDLERLNGKTNRKNEKEIAREALRQ